MRRVRVKRPKSISVILREAVNDCVPAEFLPYRDDVINYLSNHGEEFKPTEHWLTRLCDGTLRTTTAPKRSKAFHGSSDHEGHITDSGDSPNSNLPSQSSKNDKCTVQSETNINDSQAVSVHIGSTVTNPSSCESVIGSPAIATGFRSVDPVIASSSLDNEICASTVTSDGVDPPSVEPVTPSDSTGGTCLASTAKGDGSAIPKVRIHLKLSRCRSIGKGSDGGSSGAGDDISGSAVSVPNTSDDAKACNKRLNDRKLMWPLNCWICREPIDRIFPYIVCNSVCKRVYHTHCEDRVSIKLRFPLKPMEEDSDAGAANSTTDKQVPAASVSVGDKAPSATLPTGTSPPMSASSDKDDIYSDRESPSNSNTVSCMSSTGRPSIDSVDTTHNDMPAVPKETNSVGTLPGELDDPCEYEEGDWRKLVKSSTGWVRVTRNCVYRECTFCMNSLGGCSACFQYVPMDKLIRCLIEDCTSAYCYPKCLRKVRTIVPDMRSINLHRLIYGDVNRLLDTKGRPVFICHSHACWSCYDSERYSYIWETLWRLEANRFEGDYMSNIWKNLKRTCRGKVEGSYFAKGKRIARPPLYPDIRGYKSYISFRRIKLHGNPNFVTGALYPPSDDEDFEKFDRVSVNVLLRCVRCERTWCTGCLHPDVRLLQHSGKQIICHDCFHLEKLTPGLPRHRRRNPQESSGPAENSQTQFSTHPRDIYNMMLSHLYTHEVYRSKVAMDPVFLDPTTMYPATDVVSTQEVGQRKYRRNNNASNGDPNSSGKQTARGVSKEVAPNGAENSTTPNRSLTVKLSSASRNNATKPEGAPPDTEDCTDDILSRLSKRGEDICSTDVKNQLRGYLDRLRCKEFNTIIRDIDPVDILRLCSEFRYMTSNVVSDESFKTLVSEAPYGRCSCSTSCITGCINKSNFVECTSVNCGLGELNCGNRRFKNMGIPKLRLRTVPGKGIGAFATDFIQKNELVCEYVGKMISHAEFQSCVSSWSFAELDDANNSHWYIMKVHKDVYIDSTNMGNVARFINHSCDPNCVSVPYKVNGTFRMGVFAQRPILKDEEVTYNYGFSSRGVGIGFRCLCGADNCKGMVGVVADSTTSTLEGIENTKYEGKEIETLTQLMFDMCSLYSSTKDAHCIKSKPSPVDILNGIWTSGDLYRYERSQTLLRLRAECDVDESSKLPASPIAPLLADNAIMNHALLNYCKLMVMGGYCMKEWDLCNTKDFAAGIPWSIVALENNEISLLRALESGCAFPDFYYSAKRFIQRVSMVQSRRYGGIQGCENLQRLMDLTWGATECCYVCSGYGDCKNCDHCGDVLHDDNACGDFHVDQSGMNLCNMCQNSSHRLDWLLASDIVRERLAMRLWQLRMDRDYGHSREILRNIVQRKSVITPAIRHAALVEDTSPERFANALTQFTVNPEHVFCTKREVERYSKSHVGFIDGQSRYHVMCQNAIGNYECFW